MINFDSHVHTEYCGHAPGMSLQAIAQKADQLKLDNLLIAEHIFSTKETQLYETLKSDLAKINCNCNILLGFEVDVDPMKFDGSFVTANDTLSKAQLIMGAVHYVPGVGNYPHSPQENPLSPEQLLTDWRSSLLGMLQNPIVDILAHPGRLPAASLDLDIFFDDVIVVLEEAAEISAENNIAWEINNLTCARLKKSVLSRWHHTIQAAINAGVKITYGSDSHAPDDINTQGYVQQMLPNLENFKGFISPADILRDKNER